MEQGWNPNTVLSCVLKTMLRSDRSMKQGKEYLGVFRRDVASEEFHYDEHYTFIQTLPATGKRNPRVFDGQFITVTRWDDGSLHPNFKAVTFGRDFNIVNYAYCVGYELRHALGSLLEG